MWRKQRSGYKTHHFSDVFLLAEEKNNIKNYAIKSFFILISIYLDISMLFTVYLPSFSLCTSKYDFFIFKDQPKANSSGIVFFFLATQNDG
jgi:hypothetical protein